ERVPEGLRTFPAPAPGCMRMRGRVSGGVTPGYGPTALRAVWSTVWRGDDQPILRRTPILRRILILRRTPILRRILLLRRVPVPQRATSSGALPRFSATLPSRPGAFAPGISH